MLSEVLTVCGDNFKGEYYFHILIFLVTCRGDRESIINPFLFTLLIATFDQVVLVTKIGQGTFGTVHKAVWCGVVVAAKVLPVPVHNQPTALAEIELCRYTVIALQLHGNLDVAS